MKIETFSPMNPSLNLVTYLRVLIPTPTHTHTHTHTNMCVCICRK